MKKAASLVLLAILFGLSSCDTVSMHPSLENGDWPQYRADAGRTGFTPSELPGALTLRWKREQAAPIPAWHDVHTRMVFDYAYEPVISGKTLFYGSSVDCKVYAVDTATGKERWAFFTDAPVRFAPTLWKDRVFVISDDGCLYCLDARKGRLLWKKRGAPEKGMLLGNGRMISCWPARGGAAVKDDVLYFGAGIWPSDGIFLYALNPADGNVLWVNDDSGDIEMDQPHGGARAKSGISSQGYILTAGDRLFVPTGRAVPAALDLKSGAFDYFHLQRYRSYGGSRMMATDKRLFVASGNTRDDREIIGKRTALFTVDTGVLAVRDEFNSQAVAATPDYVFTIDAGDRELKAYDLSKLIIESDNRDSESEKNRPARLNDPAWTIPTGEPDAVSLIVAGDRIISGTINNKVVLMDAETKSVLGKYDVDGIPYSLAVAHGKLYVSTDKGTMYCFDSGSRLKPDIVQNAPVNAPYGDNDLYARAADEILLKSGITEGYCLDIGCGDGFLSYELARRTNLHIIACDPDPKNVAKARRLIDSAGLYGSRITLHQGDVSDLAYPDYFANLIVSGRSVADGSYAIDIVEATRIQRPYGGTICTGSPGSMNIDVRGELDGAGEWKHQYHDPANTITSTDNLVKGDLGMLWFDDPDFDVPSRHGRGIGPLFSKGRMFVQGIDGIRAYDAYNGNVIWEYSIPAIQSLNDFDHALGTALTHQNWCIDNDRLYVRVEHALGSSDGRQVLILDTATGSLLGTLTVPKLKDATFLEYWGYLAVDGGTVYGSVVNYDHSVNWGWGTYDTNKLFSESVALFAMDAESGGIKWMYRAKDSIRHNAIAIGGGRVYLIDRPVAAMDRKMLRTSDYKPSDHPFGRLIALDAESGKTIYSKSGDIYGTLLALSVGHDALVMTYQATRFALTSEFGGRMSVFRASDGDLLWEAKTGIDRDKEYPYSSRPIINGGTIFLDPDARDLLSGRKLDISFEHSYTCGIVASAKNMLVYRSATLGYFDLDRPESGTRNYGGIRPGCWINAIPAGGLVLMPDATDRCNCSYLNKATVALRPVIR